LAVTLIRRRRIDPRRVFGLVFVKNDVAFVIEGSFQQPFENAGRICRVCETTLWILAVDAADIIFGDGAPVRIAIGMPLPTFNSREESFDTWTVALYGIGLSVTRCVRH
jgi:hypothetical protein